MNVKIKPNNFRRNILKLALFSPLLLQSCATNMNKPKPEPIMVNTDGVKDLSGLIAAIKKAAGDSLPSTVKVEDFYKSFAKAFIDNAHKAIDIGMKIPDWVVDHLPSRKVASNEIKPAYIFITLLGVVLILPTVFFYMLLLASLITITSYITDLLRKTDA